MVAGKAAAAPVAREVALVSIAALTYGAIRALTEGSAAEAVRNGRRLLDLERSLGLAWEEALQSPVLAHDVLVTAANWVYIWGHWPVIAAAAVALYRLEPPSYRLLRNAMLISGAIGFLFFALLPVAPPRLIDAGLVDTVLERSSSYRTLQPPSLTNQYAALPSLHFGWNLLVGIVLFRTWRHRLVRPFALAMPAAMALAVVVTANHFVIDVVAGGALVLAALVVAGAVERASPTLVEDVAVVERRARAPSSPVRRRSPVRKRGRPPARGGAPRHLARRG